MARTADALFRDTPIELRPGPAGQRRHCLQKGKRQALLVKSGPLARRQGELLASLVRWYAPAEVLVMATAANAELLALSGERNPYPGRLGVIEQDALADLLLVDGDPVADITLLADPAKNLAVIVKDGRIFKNTL